MSVLSMLNKSGPILYLKFPLYFEKLFDKINKISLISSALKIVYVSMIFVQETFFYKFDESNEKSMTAAPQPAECGSLKRVRKLETP